jgi:hypothetical protein
LDPYTVGAHLLGVVNDDFNGMEHVLSYRLPRCAWSTSCRTMMVLMLDVLETCVRALETYEASCIVRPASCFFMLEAHGPPGATGDAVAAPEPSPIRRQDLEPQYTWRRRSPPYQGDGIWIHWKRGDTEALPIMEVGSGATRHVATPKPSLSGRRDPEQLDKWQHPVL